MEADLMNRMKPFLRTHPTSCSHALPGTHTNIMYSCIQSSRGSLLWNASSCYLNPWPRLLHANRASELTHRGVKAPHWISVPIEVDTVRPLDVALPSLHSIYLLYHRQCTLYSAPQLLVEDGHFVHYVFRQILG